jgi:hypothetical protein
VPTETGASLHIHTETEKPAPGFKVAKYSAILLKSVLFPA